MKLSNKLEIPDLVLDSFLVKLADFPDPEGLTVSLDHIARHEESLWREHLIDYEVRKLWESSEYMRETEPVFSAAFDLYKPPGVMHLDELDQEQDGKAFYTLYADMLREAWGLKGGE